MSNPTQKPASAPQRDMAGYIARNDRRTNDRQPAWRGKVTINGKMYLLSLWEKSDEVMSMSVTDPDTLPQPNQGGSKGGNKSESNGPSQGGYPSQQAQPPVGGDPFGDIFSP